MWPVSSITLHVYPGGWYPTGLFTGELLSLLLSGKMEGSFGGYRWMSSVFLFVSSLGFWTNICYSLEQETVLLAGKVR